MNIEFTDAFKKKLQQVNRKNPQLKLSLKKQFNLFRINPFHPSLRLHKLKGMRSEQYAIWIKGDLRALSIKSTTNTDTYIFFDLVTHDEY
ncbi:MAG: plasmid stabilization protein [Candidatus Levybacteria bacterium]|nr:plasmid stabilization protein [Candidatus Levybacteria bacterium]